MDFADFGEIQTMCSGEAAQENLQAPDDTWKIHFI